MKKGLYNTKTVITLGLVTVLVGAAVSAHATGFVESVRSMDSSLAFLPLLASIAFACNRKRD